MAGRFEIVRNFPSGATEAAWRDFLRRADLPSHYNAPEYFLEPYWDRKQCFAVLSYQGDAVTGVLTAIHEEGRITSGLPLRPQICLDPSANPVTTVDALARGLLAEAGRAEIVTLYAWSWTPLDALVNHGYRRRVTEGAVVLDLRLGPDELFKCFDEGRRRNIRQAMKKGVEVSPASTPEDFRAYYEVFKAWRLTPRKVIEADVPFEAFERAARLTGNHRYFLARHLGRVIAGISLRFLQGGLLEYAGNSSLDEFLHLKPNDLLHWRAIEWAHQEGFPRYSLSAAHPFLRRFGGEVVPIHRYRLDRTRLRRHDRRETAADFARQCFHKLPASLQRRLRKSLGRNQ
ncbi:MAG: GNAT family N-acetyltransferase [Terriglobia bacterium]